MKDVQRSSRWQQVKGLLLSSWHSLASVFTSSLGLTTALLMFIWFANALTYYGEVLLTVTVSFRSCETSNPGPGSSQVQIGGEAAQRG